MYDIVIISYIETINNLIYVVLGDEMGLGKTMQAIAGFCDLSAKGGTHFLVVCPLSVVVNWKREIESQSELKAI